MVKALRRLIPVLLLALAGCGGNYPYGPTLAGPAATLTISPANPIVASGGQVQFVCAVTIATNPQVTWSVSPTGPAAINSAGLFTAGASRGTYTVTATSVQYPQVSQSTTVTVTAAPAYMR